MKHILFATGNQHKVAEAKLACEPLGIEVRNRSLAIDEIQSQAPLKISEHKVRMAYELTQEPVVVTDTYWNIPALNGFPGAYMRDASTWFSDEDFLLLMSNKPDKRVSFSDNIAFYDGAELKFFSKEFWGVIVPPRGNGRSIENVAEFDGSTLAEQHDRGAQSHSVEDYVWVDFARWFAQR